MPGGLVGVVEAAIVGFEDLWLCVSKLTELPLDLNYL